MRRLCLEKVAALSPLDVDFLHGPGAVLQTVGFTQDFRRARAASGLDWRAGKPSPCGMRHKWDMPHPPEGTASCPGHPEELTWSLQPRRTTSGARHTA